MLSRQFHRNILAPLGAILLTGLFTIAPSAGQSGAARAWSLEAVLAEIIATAALEQAAVQLAENQAAWDEQPAIPPHPEEPAAEALIASDAVTDMLPASGPEPSPVVSD